eukprot:scaffold7349_cov173-Amphora_coffeaeformis.AAC.41
MRSRRTLPLGSSTGSRRDRSPAVPDGGVATPSDKSPKKAQAPPATTKTELRSAKASANGSALKSTPSSEKRGKTPNTPTASVENGAGVNEDKILEKPREKPETRRRSDSQGDKKSQRENSKKRKVSDSLKAVMTNGSIVSVNIILNGTTLTSADASAIDTVKDGYLGNDGNQFYCQVCQGFGDVVCCDGCPSVFHPHCVPQGPSKDSLDNNEDPWFCPNCIIKMKPIKVEKQPKKVEKQARRSDKGDRLSSHHRCTDCHEVLEGVDVKPCDQCGNYVHHPSCHTDKPQTKRALCSTCFAVDALSQEDEAEFEEEDIAEEKQDEDLAEDENSQMDVSGGGMDHDSDEEGSGVRQTKRKKRKHSIDESGRKNRKDGSAKKKKKKKNSLPVDDAASQEESQASYATPTKPLPIAQATPAFFFYLAENRWKIERVLSKRSRAFNRLSRGRERNGFVAKEAAIWWSKLRPSDHKRYVNMSMRDFEGRVIEWKEDKSIREMSLDIGSTEIDPDTDLKDYSEEDKRLTVRKHKRLFISTSVGSKIFKPEADQNYNRVMMDLLHDSRFHPLPMLGVNRDLGTEDNNEKEDPSSKVLIPHFEIHGPVASSVGDECLGCLRGWVHFCPVLQRRLPALEPRAKLQPPLSSLLATRIGLGIRQPVWKKEFPPSQAKDNEPNLFEVRASDDYKKLKDLPVLPSATLDDTNERMDDVVEFIEQAIAMRVPEPPRPEDDPNFAKAVEALPGRPKDSAADAANALHKCGRCRAILKGDTGCFQCRRAQLVINLAKRNKQDTGKILRIQTNMLGRVNLQERSETQSSRDQAVASAILRERWMPHTVLEPPTIYTPDPSKRPETFEQESSIAESSEDSDNETTSHQSMEIDSPTQTETPRTVSVRPETGEKDRPVRSARSSASFSESYEPEEHQAVLEENRKQVNSFQRRVVTVACCGMLHALLRRDPLMLFHHEVTIEGYLDVVKNPIDYSKIRDKVMKDGYQSVAAFSSDVKLLCENALLYNAQNTIYAKVANEMLELLATMQKDAVNWISTLRDVYARHLAGDEVRRRKMMARLEDISHSSEDEGDPFEELRAEWPEAVEMLENEEWIKAQVDSDFIRTKENEIAYYGSLAVSRAAYAAEVSLAPYTDSKGVFNIVGMRSHLEDQALRERVDGEVANFVGPPRLKDPSTWREESVHRLLRRLQSRRLDAKTASEQGCARCDGLDLGQDVQIATKAEQAAGKAKRSEEHGELNRVDRSRMHLTTGLASANNREVITKRKQQTQAEQFDSVNDACVSVRGSKIHGWGLYADQEFEEEDVVAEYVGEYINNETAEEREKLYRDQRIQDYMFRVNDDLVIDATIKGGNGRYANHSCGPNCYAKNIPADGKKGLRRVMIIALKPIKVNEEITYDYQFPLEMDLDNRLPCNCRAETCRGFMNWDLPERGNVTPMLVQKRGANMRDRIRRLGRPLKRDEN